MLDYTQTRTVGGNPDRHQSTVVVDPIWFGGGGGNGYGIGPLPEGPGQEMVDDCNVSVFFNNYQPKLNILQAFVSTSV